MNPLVRAMADSPAPPKGDSWQVATVTSASPPRVLLDSDVDAETDVAINLAPALVVGDRVWCGLHREPPPRTSRRVVLYGVIQ